MATTWLITGVSTGLGRAFAQAALERGDTVLGTVRKERDKAAFLELSTSGKGKAVAILLDVCDQVALMNLPQVLGDALAGAPLDVLINNAGYGVLGAFEELSDAQVRQQMEVNFFGALGVTRAALPFLREAAATKNQSTIVQISSVAGQTGSAGLSLYNASKWALEGFSEALSAELSHLGIRVVIVEPGAFRTDWAGRSMDTKKSSSNYEKTVGLVEERLSKINGTQQGDPAKAAQLVLKLVDSKTPPLRIPFGNDSFDRISGKLKAQQSDLLLWEKDSRALWFEQ